MNQYKQILQKRVGKISLLVVAISTGVLGILFVSLYLLSIKSRQPTPEGADYAPNKVIGINPGVGVNRPLDAGYEDLTPKLETITFKWGEGEIEQTIDFREISPKSENFFKGTLEKVFKMQLTYNDVLGIIYYAQIAWLEAKTDEERQQVMRRVINTLYYNDFLARTIEKGDIATVQKVIWAQLNLLNHLADCSDGERSLNLLKQNCFYAIGRGCTRVLTNIQIPFPVAVSKVKEVYRVFNVPFLRKTRAEVGTFLPFNPVFWAEEAIPVCKDQGRVRQLTEFVKEM